MTRLSRLERAAEEAVRRYQAARPGKRQQRFVEMRAARAAALAASRRRER